MNSKKAVVVTTKTAQGISVIDIQVFNESGRRCNNPSKRLIDSINAIPFLSEKRIKAIVAKQYDLSKDDILIS
jgi:hypothetical protein